MHDSDIFLNRLKYGAYTGYIRGMYGVSGDGERLVISDWRLVIGD
jgi:hypothetical protein